MAPLTPDGYELRDGDYLPGAPVSSPSLVLIVPSRCTDREMVDMQALLEVSEGKPVRVFRWSLR